MIIGCAMENFSDLLKKAFPVELGGTDEGVFSQKNVLTFQCGIETK